jgi:hypothetical protein
MPTSNVAKTRSHTVVLIHLATRISRHCVHQKTLLEYLHLQGMRSYLAACSASLCHPTPGR